MRGSVSSKIALYLNLMIKKILLAAILSAFVLPVFSVLRAQAPITDHSMLPGERPHLPGVLHQYPLPGATEESPRMNIGIRATSPFASDVLSKLTAEAVGSKSGPHKMTVEITGGDMAATLNDMLIFHPAVPFEYGEAVTFSYAAPLASGGMLSNQFSYVTKVPVASDQKATFVDQELADIAAYNATAALTGAHHDRGAIPMDADPNLPKTLVTVWDHPTPGEIYWANYGKGGAIPLFSHLIAFDDSGNVLRSLQIPGAPTNNVLDFTPQPNFSNNRLTYWSYASGKFFLTDTTLTPILDTYQVAESVDSTDGHEFHMFPDGGYAILGVDTIRQDLTIPYGGLANAIIGWSTIEVFNKDKKQVFYWNGKDHFFVTDAVKVRLSVQPGTKSQTVDIQHSNSLDFDAKGDIILSSRHLCEITKIDGASGNTIWHLGGKNNQFQLIGDSVWFSYQHDARWQKDGHMTLFDNSNFDSVQGRPSNDTIRASRAVEYALDTVAKTATLVWQYHHTPDILCIAMGSVQRLDNLNTLIGWGVNSVNITEVEKVTNKTLFELTTTNGDFGYRATKVPYGSASIAVQAKQPSLSTTLEIEPATGDQTMIHYVLAKSESVSLKVYDALGREVRVLCAGAEESVGDHLAPLDLTGLASGTYYCVLRMPEGTANCTFSRTK